MSKTFKEAVNDLILIAENICKSSISYYNDFSAFDSKLNKISIQNIPSGQMTK